MPISRKFVFEQDEDSGLIGLKPLWIANANATTKVAHDILEHFYVPKLNAIEAEFAAIGALLALRIETGVFHQTLDFVEQLASAAYGVLSDMSRDNEDPPRSRKSRALDEAHEWADDLILKAVPRAYDTFLRDEETMGTVHCEATPIGRALQDPAALQETVVALLRFGYRRAHRRYEDQDMYTLGNSVFKKLDAFSTRLVDSEMLQLGDEVVINVHPRQMRFNASVNGFSLDH